MKKVTLLAASVLAGLMSAQASAAVTPDVAFKGEGGYFRAGLFSRNFNKNVGDVGRLGNENTTNK